MNTYTKPLPGDFVGVALYAENPRYLQAVTAADIFSRDPQTTVLVAALHVGRKTTVYTAGAAPTANLDAFAVRLRELKKAGKVLVVQETLPTALLLQEQLGITFKRTFSASAWMSHRQYPTAQHVVRGIVGGELRHVDDAGRAAAPGLARARACAQEASDAVAVATLALSDPSFTAMEWQVVEYHARNSLRGIHLDGERAQVLLAEAREQLAAFRKRSTAAPCVSCCLPSVKR